MTDVTLILDAIRGGGSTSDEDLLPIVYEELRRLAAQMLSQERPGHALQATALVHEAYLRLVAASHRQSWENRRHFFGAAAEAMRRILIDDARKRKSARHGGQHRHVELPPEIAASQSLGGVDLADLSEALDQLAAVDDRKATLVKLRVFAGLSMDEAAAALDISLATAKRDWTFARAWLYSRLADCE